MSQTSTIAINLSILRSFRNVLTEQHVPGVGITIVVRMTVKTCRNRELTRDARSSLMISICIIYRSTILRSDDIFSQLPVFTILLVALTITIDACSCSNLISLRGEIVLGMATVILSTLSLC